MKKVAVCVALAGLAGCTNNAPKPDSADIDYGENGKSVEVGTAEQKAQFADDTAFPVVDYAANPQILLTADFTPVDVNVYYVSDKTTDSGHTVGTVTLKATISLAADQTKLHTIPILTGAAFAGGYGAILLDSTGNGPFDVFQAHLISAEGGIEDVGGSVFRGGSFRIPYLGGSSKVVLAMTNVSDFAFDIQIFQIGTANIRTINLSPFSTYKFDSSAYSWNLGSAHNSIQIFTTAGGVVAVTGYEMKGTTKYRVAPVKAAPY